MYLVENRQKQNSTEVIVFSRDKYQKKQVQVIKDFSPYFYILEAERVPEDYRITKVEKGFLSILGENLKKIYVKKSIDVRPVRYLFNKTFEADIPFHNRYTIDEIGEVDIYPLNIGYIDIETDSPKGEFPDTEVPNQKIVSIAFVDTFKNKPITLTLNNQQNNFKPTEGVEVFESEEDLLGNFLSIWIESDLDVITGWSVDTFDLTYIIRRMIQLGIDYRKLSPIRSVNINEMYGDVNIKGIIVLDLMKGYKHFRRISNQGKADSYSLEYTAQSILGKGKIPHLESFRDLWLTKPNLLVEYNIRDTLLVKELNEKLKIIDFFNSIRAKACSQLSDIYYSSTLIDGRLLRKVHNKFILPTSTKQKRDGKFSGAIVLKTKPGLHKNVMVLDLKALYPSIIETFYISFENFNPNGDIKLYEGIGYDKKADALIPSSLVELKKERAIYKKLMYNSKTEEERLLNYFRQYSIKVISNAHFGYLGFPNSRLFKKEVAESITTMGRKIIEHSIKILEDHGYDIIYGDTDSVFITAKETSKLKILKEGQELTNLLNDSYKEFTQQFGTDKCTIEMEFEKVFKRILFPNKINTSKDDDGGAKKRYAYIPLWYAEKDVEDKIGLTGFGAVRSDVPKIAKEIQRTVLENILREHPKEDILTYLKTTYKKVIKSEISDEDFGIPGGISKPLKNYGETTTDKDGKKRRAGTPPVIAGSLYSNKYLGTRFGMGDKPKWVYVKAVPMGYPITSVISYEDNIPKNFKPDLERMCDRIFYQNINAIWESMGWNKLPILKENNGLNI